MSNLAILHSPNSSNILNNFSATPQAQKQKIRTLIGQGVKNNIDFSNFLTEANAKIANQISKDSRSGGQIEKTINDWHEKVAMANEEHRRNLRNLGQNLASSVGFSYGSDGNQQLINDIQNSVQRNLGDNNFSQGYVNPQEAKSQIDQILQICDPNRKEPQLSTLNTPSQYQPVRANASNIYSPSPVVTPQNGSSRAILTPLRENRDTLLRNPSNFDNINLKPPSSTSHGLNTPMTPPKYYRIDEKGNRIEIEDPNKSKQFNTVLSSQYQNLPSANKIPQSPVTYSQSPLQNRGSVALLNPNRGLASNIESPGRANISNLVAKSLNQSYNQLPQQMERRIIFTDPATGQQKMKITTPRGNTVLRIENIDNVGPSPIQYALNSSLNVNPINVEPYRKPQQATIISTPQKDMILPSKPKEKLISTPSRLMQQEKTPTRAGYSPGGLYQNKPMSPYNYTPGGSKVNTRQNEFSQDTLDMIKDARADFESPYIEDVEVNGNPTKIEVSENGQTMYYAGDALGKLQRGADLWLYNKGRVNEISK